jgi:uncharacterized membrane protein
MEQPKTSKYAMQYGLFLGLASIAFNVMLYTQELHYEQNATTYIVGFALLFIFSLLGILAYKKANEGFISIGQSLKIGVGVSVIGALIGIVYFLIFIYAIEPGYVDKVMEIGRETAIANNPEINREQLDQGIAFQKKFFAAFTLIGVIINAIVGLVISLILGLIVQKTRN